MWLINVTTLKLENFTICPSGKYAILSHTWEDEELDFQTFAKGEGRQKKGFQKIKHCCQQAIADGYDHAWVDTCCIDKRSSAELSEAINSMFAWYKDAGTCYAYLVDLELQEPIELQKLGQCKWFTRGWTLQELLAPPDVFFYTSDWRLIGSRLEFAGRLQHISGIDKEVLKGNREIRKCSIAQRMSWAAKRNTTRIEDTAYCLLGLFDVSMSLLYGEGSAAFLRLQEIIIGSSDDESIFVWTGIGPDGAGLLARSPANFEKAANIESTNGQWSRPLYHTTNRGLKIECQLVPACMNTYKTPLQCRRTEVDADPIQLGIYVCRTADDDQYRRVALEGVDLMELKRFDTWTSLEPVNRVLYINDRMNLPLAPHGGMPVVRLRHESRLESTESQNHQHIMAYPNSHQPAEQPNENNSLEFRHTSQDLEAASPRPMPPIGHETAYPFEITDVPAPRIGNFRQSVSCYDLRGPVPVMMRIGFNVDFEPVCFLHSSWAHALSGSYPPDQKYMTDMWRCVELCFTSMIDYDTLQSGWAIPASIWSSAWALKGDRHKGLHAKILIPWPTWWSPWRTRVLSIHMARTYPMDVDSHQLTWKLAVDLDCQRVPTSSGFTFPASNFIGVIFMLGSGFMLVFVLIGLVRYTDGESFIKGLIVTLVLVEVVRFWCWCLVKTRSDFH